MELSNVLLTNSLQIKDADIKERQKIEETAQQFEAFFARTLLKPLTENISDAEISTANEQITSILAEQIAKNNVLGIGEQVKGYLEKK